MNSDVVARWGFPVAVVLAAGGAGTAWLGSAVGAGPSAQAGWLVGVVLCGLAVAALIWTASARTRRDDQQRKLSKYGCSRCGYTPRAGELESNESLPCPTCGRPMYEH